jgi:hypothetical protein
MTRWNFKRRIKRLGIDRKHGIAFVFGILIMFIFLMPFTIRPSLSYVESEVLYSEDAILYNQMYNEIFDSLGEAGEDSFLLIETFNITQGIGFSVELIYNEAAVDVERLVIFQREDGVVYRKVTLSTVSSPYMKIVEIDTFGLYGIALFCTHISSLEPVLLSINVMVIAV